MRALLAVLLVVLPALSGCAGLFDGEGDGDRAVRPADVGHDPATIRVTGVEKAAYTVPSFDGTDLATVVYAPVTGDFLPDGSPPRWGVVVMLHGWGVFKEQFEGFGGATGAPEPPVALPAQAKYVTNRLEAFAEQGVIAVAYDARGFGRSTGQATVAGPAEMADLDAILDFVESQYPTSGLVGVLGQSYGGGQSFLAWADNPRITTAAPMYGWVDLYHGLAPGNVPKAEWAAELLGVGTAGTKGMLSPMLAEWVQKGVTRTDLETVQAEMAQRSALPRMAGVTKPLFVCQGLQETLFPQADLAWSSAGGFTRALLFQGGHGVDPEECWTRTLDWMLYFVAGKDTGVDGWPALTSVDASGAGGAIDYTTFPTAQWTTSYLDAPSLEAGPGNLDFTVSQRLLGNPFVEPSGLWDLTQQPNNEVPEQFRQDPTATFFESAPFTGSEVLLGAPILRLRLADAEQALPYQVVASLYQVDVNGKSQLLSRAAHAALTPADVDTGADGNATLELRFDWVKASLGPDDVLVLKVGGNDPSMFLPLPANYDVTFTGDSQLLLPFFG